jgi:hypothetical protein
MTGLRGIDQGGYHRYCNHTIFKEPETAIDLSIGDGPFFGKGKNFGFF